MSERNHSVSQEVLEARFPVLVAEGKTYDEIAAELGMAVPSLKTRISTMKTTMRVASTEFRVGNRKKTVSGDEIVRERLAEENAKIREQNAHLGDDEKKAPKTYADICRLVENDENLTVVTPGFELATPKGNRGRSGRSITSAVESMRKAQEAAAAAIAEA